MDAGDVREAAVGALERMRSGVATAGEVAKLAAEVLANPPAAMVAARRYLSAVGTEHGGAAAVAFLVLFARQEIPTDQLAAFVRQHDWVDGLKACRLSD